MQLQTACLLLDFAFQFLLVSFLSSTRLVILSPLSSSKPSSSLLPPLPHLLFSPLPFSPTSFLLYFPLLSHIFSSLLFSSLRLKLFSSLPFSPTSALLSYPLPTHIFSSLLPLLSHIFSSLLFSSLLFDSSSSLLSHSLPHLLFSSPFPSLGCLATLRHEPSSPYCPHIGSESPGRGHCGSPTHGPDSRTTVPARPIKFKLSHLSLRDYYARIIIMANQAEGPGPVTGPGGPAGIRSQGGPGRPGCGGPSDHHSVTGPAGVPGSPGAAVPRPGTRRPGPPGSDHGPARVDSDGDRDSVTGPARVGAAAG
eukprot:766407-Hanusia_phi.AAC.5